MEPLSGVNQLLYCLKILAQRHQFFLFALCLCCATGNVLAEPVGHNRLGKEKSPYLLQHKDNPIWWYPWGDEAFQEAKKRDVPIFLSIGHAACHWCDKMEKGAFSDQGVAKLLNDSFVSIKVDRDEHPDVDRVYMQAVTVLRRAGGWPMTIICDTKGEPIFAGNYFTADKLTRVLETLSDTWKTDRSSLSLRAERLMKRLNRELPDQYTIEFNEDLFKYFFTQLRERYDVDNGGFGKPPRELHPIILRTLLRIQRRTGNKYALEMIERTLDAIAYGGTFDQLGGGIHHLSLDDKWTTPHFAKMLFENALMATVYLEAYQLTGKDHYLQVGKEILDYLIRDMQSEDGAFYASEGSNPEGELGRYYRWEEKELVSKLSEREREVFQKIYLLQDAYKPKQKKTPSKSAAPSPSVEPTPSLTSKIILRKRDQPWGMKYEKEVQALNKKLLSLRDARTRPTKDFRILTGWNGLAIDALALGYRLTNDHRYVQAAERAAKRIVSNAWSEGRLHRRLEKEAHRKGSVLDDYALFVDGLIGLYQADYNAAWLDWAEKVQAAQHRVFWDKERGAYFYAGDDLLLRPKIFIDGELPNGNAYSALNLLRLYAFTYNEAYKEQFDKVLIEATEPLVNDPSDYSGMLLAVDYLLDRSKEIAVVSLKEPEEDALTQNLLQTLNEAFLPNAITAFVDTTKVKASDRLPIFEKKLPLHEKTTVYVCENKICRAPTSDPTKVKELITHMDRYRLR